MTEARAYPRSTAYEPDEAWIVDCLVSGLIRQWQAMPADLKDRIIAGAVDASDRLHSDPPVEHIVAEFIRRHSADLPARHMPIVPDDTIVESMPYGTATFVLRQVDGGWQVEIEPGHHKTDIYADRYSAQGEAEIFADNNGLGPLAR